VSISDREEMADRKIKIMHVIDSLGIGGMERVVIDVANGLDAVRFEQTICCLSRRGEAANFLRGGVRCIDLAKGDKADRLMPLKIARVIRQEQPDIVHSQSWSGVDTGLARLMTPGIKLVHSEHGRHVPYIHAESLKRRIARRCLYHLADSVFAISAEVREFYCRESGFPAERMAVIPNGIDIRRIDEADRRGVRQEFGFIESDFVIGTVARLDATKDTHTLVRAFAQLHHAQPDSRLKLLIVGDGAERTNLESFVGKQELNHAVVFTGLRHDVPRLLGAMNVFSLSSLSEGMPLTVMEAMAARLPVVATNVGALPELVEESATGFLTEPEDAAGLAERLRKLYQNPEMANLFGTNARRKVEQEFSLDRMLRRYANLYVSVLQKKEKAI
jgi:sugar transferase (PEP-CTERM/EpsH1 system associated)